VKKILSLTSKRHITVLTLLLFVVIAFGGYLIYHHQADAVRSGKYKLLSSIGKLKSDQIVNWLRDKDLRSEVFVNPPFFADAVSEFLHSPTDEKLKEKIRFRLELVQKSF
jgi:hypothetical protein